MRRIKKKAGSPPVFPGVIFVYAALAISVLLVFGQAGDFDFVNYDDGIYVYENPRVQAGLTREGVAEAFGTSAFGYWQPLTWLSLMLDGQLFGCDPGRMHLVNVFFHLANTLLLFGVLRAMTGRLWPSAFAAAAFALHPMHVESVAWISERKDVLSTFFLMLTLAAYARYVRRPSAGWYLAGVVLFALGLMAKPMLVTAPFVLLLLDYWPLRRFEGTRRFWRILVEKVPFFVLSGISCVVTFLTQQGSGEGVIVLTWKERMFTVLSSYAVYLGKFFWPVNLAAYYPSEGLLNAPGWTYGLSAVLLAGVTVWAVWAGRRRKYLPVGWLWFVGTLVPVVGLVRFTGSLYGDRFTYIPYIGLLIAAAWGAADLVGRRPHGRGVPGVVMAALLAAMGIASYQQAGVWRDGVSLFSHAVTVTEKNYIAYSNLGVAYYNRGRYDEAVRASQEAIRIHPEHANAHNNLGSAYHKLGRKEEALAAFRAAGRIRPDYPDPYNNLGLTYYSMGRYAEAVQAYREAIGVAPEYAEAYNNLGAAYGAMGRWEEAVEVFGKALQLTPQDAGVRNNVGLAYNNLGRYAEAIELAEQTLQAAPDDAQAYYTLGVSYSHLERWPEAIRAFERAVQIVPGYADAYYNLGTVYGRLGRWPEAVAAFRQAVRVRPKEAAFYLALGFACAEAGDKAAAMKVYQTLRMLNADMAEGLLKRIER